MSGGQKLFSDKNPKTPAEYLGSLKNFNDFMVLHDEHPGVWQVLMDFAKKNWNAENLIYMLQIKKIYEKSDKSPGEKIAELIPELLKNANLTSPQIAALQEAQNLMKEKATKENANKVKSTLNLVGEQLAANFVIGVLSNYDIKNEIIKTMSSPNFKA